jgi:hypothetical protein
MTSAATVSQPLIQRTLHALFALTLAFFALAASSAAWADPPGRVGRIAETDGNVWLFDDEQGEWVQARRNRPVTEGDRISAEQGGRAEVQIGAATLRLDGATDVEFTQLNDARVRVRLHGGSVALRVRGGESVREFAVVTNEGRYEPLRPGHYRVDVRDQSSLGETLAGAMRFESSDSVLDLADGQRAEFWQERGVTHYAWATPQNDRFGDWVARQDREDTRERNRYVSNEMTGADDLDRNGRWDRHPEYGAVWYPTVVAADWAPYRYGQWVYTRYYGWTWVDDAPWGFAPFHYGRWVSYGGRWGWCPGQYVARPVYAPALVAWFGGPHVSVGINIGGPAVGWVPLAPREIYYPSYNVTNVYVRNVNVTHSRWQGPNPRYERTVPTGPIMYTNQGVAGGVTVVPQGVMQSRQPINSRVAVPVDNRTVAAWQGAGSRNVQGAPAGNAYVPPAPPAARVVAAPGGAVPAAPGAVRQAPWSGPAARVVGAGQGDGGQPNRGERVPSAEQRNGASNGRGVVAPPTGQSPNVPRPVPPPAAQQGQPQIVQQPVPTQREGVPQRQRDSVPQGQRDSVPQGQRDSVPQGQRDSVPQSQQRESRDQRHEREDRGAERRVAPPPAVQRAPAPVEGQRPVGPSPNVVIPAPPRPQQAPQVQQPQQPQQPQGNPGQARERERERERERAQERDDERRGEGPRRMREQLVR